jgi:uncharacterized protein with ATP-grasp and redox domains
MKVELDCLPCFLRQALEASRLASADITIQRRILKDAVKIIGAYDSYGSAPEVGRAIHALVKRYSGLSDPYRELKLRNIELAKQVYPDLKHFLFRHREDWLYWTLKIAATGNVFDAAIYGEIRERELLQAELEKQFAIDDGAEFAARLRTAKTLLIIGDNAGETVFDRVLIEQLLNLEIIYAVRSGPIINDATLEDARCSDLERGARVLSTGCDAPGLILAECGRDFREAFYRADLVISKGQGNYETLTETGREIFFLLKAKCPVIAEDIGVTAGDYVFLSNVNRKNFK